MRAQKWAFGAVVLLLAGYAATPYVVVWRLAEALRHADTQSLAAAVDWGRVRAGLKADIADGIVGDFASGGAAPLAENSAAALPPFGASFINGIAGSMIDREVTPEHLATLMRQLGPADGDTGASLPLRNVRHAFFTSPATFEVSVLCPGQEADEAPLRIALQLRKGHWQVVRAWVPQDLIDLANSRT